MHTPQLAKEAIEILWDNYLTLSEHKDLEAMPYERLMEHVEKKTLVRPFHLAALMGRQGFFISAWSIWEFYSRSLCADLVEKVKTLSSESTVQWVRRSLDLNKKTFSDFEWFASANNIRNLIAHSGGRVIGSKGKMKLANAKTAYPDLEVYADDYIAIHHEHVANLVDKIDNYIVETGS